MSVTYWMRFQLSLRSYIPKRLETGMMFLIFTGENEPFVFRLERTPVDEEQFIKDVGYPVEPYIVDIGENPDVDVEKVIVEPDEIGWMDEGEFTDELVSFDCPHINRILSGYGGELELEMEEDEEGNYTPVIFESLVTVRYLEFEEETNEEEEFL